MKKYKIEIIGYDPKTKAQDYSEVLSTKAITEDKLEELIRREITKTKNVCWSVKPYPVGFHKRFMEKT